MKKLTKAGKPRKRNPRKGEGRPETKINWRQFSALCEIDCTQVEICSVLGINDKTLEKHCKMDQGKSFSDFYEEKRNLGNRSLRRAMWLDVMGCPAEYDKKGNCIREEIKPNITMKIWLSKQRLGYTDKQEHTGKDGAALNEIKITIVDGRKNGEAGKN